MDILIRTVPHQQQAYNTIGNWHFTGDGLLVVTVSELGDDAQETAIAIHEIVEALLCRKAGISEQAVNEFDLRYEQQRVAGDLSEPGNSLDSPYYEPHNQASFVEEVAAKELQVDWQKYTDTINELTEKRASENL